MFCNLTNISKAKEIEAFCLVERSDLTNAKLHSDDHSRFVGKEIYLIIDYNENIIADFSEDTAMGVITGTNGPFDAKEFEKTSNGIKYNSEIDVKGDKKDQLIKYKYNISITIVNDKPTSLHALVDQSGWSFNSWNFQIDCRDYKYSKAEKQKAKKNLFDKKKGMPEWFKPLVNKVIKDTEQELYQLYDEAVQEEKRWATHLFSKGSMIGLSEKLLHNYVEYIANRRMRAIGLNVKYEQSITMNPLPWTKHWFNSRSMQNAPQETEIESYVVGGIKQDVKRDQFKTFKL